MSVRRDFWDEWRGQEGRPTLLIKTLVRWRGFRVDLHKFLAGDRAGCFHTHPAWAVRIVLWGGYVEEVFGGRLRRFFPGRVGIVRPAFCHRVHALMARSSWSLWLRGPVVADVQLKGDGWSAEDLGAHEVTET